MPPSPINVSQPLTQRRRADLLERQIVDAKTAMLVRHLANSLT
ncbi:MAG: hypothetical protein AAF548_19185 [Actinomycetota bacterium]